MPYFAPRFLFRRYTILRHVQPGGVFLEIGPGNLQLAQELLTFFNRGVVLDFDTIVVDIYQNLQSTVRSRLNLIIDDFFDHKFVQPFDCVVFCEVLEHVADDEAFLMKVIDLLRPDGQLVLSVPSRMKFWSVHDELVGHIRRYEKSSLRTLLSGVGFRNISIYSYGFPFVNVLRTPRIWLAKRRASITQTLDQREKTAVSGIRQTAMMSNWIGWLVNPISIYPFAWFSSLFDNQDWSGGYVVTAHKNAEG